MDTDILICKVIFTNPRNCPSTDPLALCQSLGIALKSSHPFVVMYQNKNLIYLQCNFLMKVALFKRVNYENVKNYLHNVWVQLHVNTGWPPPMYRVEHTKLFQQPKIELFRNKARPLFYKSWISYETIPLAFSVKYAFRMKKCLFSASEVARNQRYSVTPLLWCPLLV